MKRLFIFTTFIIINFSTCIFAQTQAEMSQTAINDYKKVDSELNKVYKEAFKNITTNEKKLLIIAQKNWILFRDSKCKFEAEQFDGGSIQPLIKYTCLKETTEARIEDLKLIVSREY